MNHEAIYKLYPNVVTISEAEGAFDKDGNKVAIDFALVDAWKNPEEYKTLRAAEYPDFRDYLDGLVKGDQAQMKAYVDACLAVKAKYPKSGA